jgi:membrane fusion protein (multidrug efflux system)
VRARLEEGVNTNAILVPQVGVTHDQSGRAVALLVGPDDQVSQVVLTTAGTRGSDWIVTGGVKPGDRVIVQGTEKVKPGARAKPVPAQLAASAAASPASAASGS